MIRLMTCASTVGAGHKISLFAWNHQMMRTYTSLIDNKSVFHAFYSHHLGLHVTRELSFTAHLNMLQRSHEHNMPRVLDMWSHSTSMHEPNAILSELIATKPAIVQNTRQNVGVKNMILLKSTKFSRRNCAQNCQWRTKQHDPTTI